MRGIGLEYWVIGRWGANLLFEAQSTLQREINPQVLSPADWQAIVATNASFVLGVLAKPRLFLIWSLYDPDQLTCQVWALPASAG